LALVLAGDLSVVERSEDIHDGSTSRCRQKQQLLQVGSDNFDEVIGGLLGGLCLPGHVIADVVFHEFTHEAVDGAAGSGEALEDVRTVGVFLNRALGRFELADDFLGTGEEVEFFAVEV
jgi:hypothetical protein